MLDGAENGTQLPCVFLPYWLRRLASPWLMCDRDLDFLEVCCGQGNLRRAFLDAGFQAIGMDREHGPEQDIGNMVGLKFLVRSIMRLKAGGLLWLAPPCKNWIFLSSSRHKRKQSNGYLGQKQDGPIKEANSLLYILAGCIRLAVSRGVHFILEQPIDSQMMKTACMAKAIRMTHAQTIATYLAAFCRTFPCPKGLHLCGAPRLLKALSRNPPAMASAPNDEVYTKDVFSGAVTGGPELEKTQIYPIEFGEAALCTQIASNTTH
jgi:hypothetical protein